MNLSEKERSFEAQFRKKLSIWPKESPWPGILSCSNIFKHIAFSSVYIVLGPASPERSITGIVIGHAVVQCDAVNSKIEARHRYSGAKVATRWNCTPGCAVGFLRFDLDSRRLRL